MHAHSQINTDIKMNTISSVSNRILSSKKINNIPDDKKQNIAIQEKNSNQCHVSGDNWQAVSGVDVENSMAKANKLINKFALTGKLGINDIRNLKNIVKSGNAQAQNVSMLLSLVNEKAVNPKTLKFVCKDGIMSDGMEKDIHMIFDAKKQGINPNDKYIPHHATQEEALKNSSIGDLFEVEGQKNIYIKNKDGQAEQLKMDKETMIKLFPPAERFANAQTHSSDCYFVSTVNSMMDSPEARAFFLQCFEQDGDDVKITFPSNNYTYTAKNGKMPKAYKGNFVTGSTGMKLVEYAYGKFLENMVVTKANEVQNKSISDLKNQLENTTDEKEQKELSAKIKLQESVISRLNEDVEKNTNEWIVELDNNREPVVNNNEGINLRSLNQMNAYRKTSFQTQGDYYRGDGGYMEDVFKDFGYKETKAYMMEDKEIQEILANPKLSKDYIFSGGTKREGRRNPLRTELIMDRSLNMYGCHAYRIAPSVNENGETVFKVSNPWNSSHNTILTMDQMKEFFIEVHVAKIQ